MTDFSRRLIDWYRRSGRHGLPWQQGRDPYTTWISEIMLQQTQVKTVIPYFLRFIEHFPDVKSLAHADLDEVLHLWSGLGYYARARNLHKTARRICEEHHGNLPADLETLTTLPGIGRSTAGAILSLSMKQSHPILDGNVKRVLTRYHGVKGWPGEREVEQKLWALAARATPAPDAADYTQAIMDLGATVCTRTRPACHACPIAADCRACRHGKQLEFPHRKVKRALPVKQAVFAIIENGSGEILLQKRPPAGIWGGLWSFPECPLRADVGAWIEQEFGSTVTGLREQQPLRHTFSHYHLDIRPIRAKLETPVSISEAGNICWYGRNAQVKLGLAAPVKKLLDSI